MTPVATITVDEAEDIVYDAVAVQKISEHRWYERQLVVFKDDDGALQGFYYLKPASELQEDQDRFESDPVQVFQVSSREVVTIVYGVVA
jgi:hypothetical protein